MISVVALGQTGSVPGTGAAAGNKIQRGLWRPRTAAALHVRATRGPCTAQLSHVQARLARQPLALAVREAPGLAAIYSRRPPFKARPLTREGVVPQQKRCECVVQAQFGRDGGGEVVAAQRQLLQRLRGRHVTERDIESIGSACIAAAHAAPGWGSPTVRSHLAGRGLQVWSQKWSCRLRACGKSPKL